MRLTATVKRATGATAHYIGGVDEEGKFGAKPASPASSVEIQEVDEGWLLLRIDASGEPITDTWHASLEEAKEQARFEYEIEDDDWKAVCGTEE